MSEQHLIIGGNAAGLTAASRAKRLDRSLRVTVLEAGRHISYSICGLPYCLAGVVERFEDLVYFTPDKLLNERGIEARSGVRAVEIQPSRRSVLVEDVARGHREVLRYDKLLIATGYRPLRPDVEGIDAAGVFTASRLEDGEAISEWLALAPRRRAVIIGGGAVGLEMTEALRRRGLDVCLVDKAPSVLPTLDADMADLVQAELEAQGVEVLTGREAERIVTRRDGSVEAVQLKGTGRLLPADIVFVDVGVEPRVDLAAAAGIEIGPSGAIRVSDRLQTNVASIFAAGNCAETIHRVTGRPTLAPLGTVAVKQGRVAGENMAGGRSRFSGWVGTSALQLFRLSVARTGLCSWEAKREGYPVMEAMIRGRFQAPYFADGASGSVKAVADASTGRLLGAQIVGGAEAALRIDVVATALACGLTVEEVAQLDMAYTPPLGALWSPVLIAMNALLRKLQGSQGLSD